MPKKIRSTDRHLPKGLAILYEDSNILVVDKPAGLLTVGTASNKTRTAHYILTDYVCKGCLKSRNRIFIVHRIDQWTSGVLVFAKSEEVKLPLQGQWKETEKKYLAVVHGRLDQKEGIMGLLKKSRLLRRCAPRNDKKYVSMSLRPLRKQGEAISIS